jgi:hypothetical protein
MSPEGFMNSVLRRLVTTAAVACLGAAVVHAQELAGGQPAERSAVEFSPVSPFIRIYAAQYARRLTANDEFIIGGGYANIKYDDGQSHAPTFIIGYRRFIWKKAHAEYQLWPSYNWYWEQNEEKYYEGAELWNEFRFGYTFDFKIGRAPWFVNAQYLVGWGLYGDDSKPQSWKDQVAREGEVFAAPMIFMGWRF